MHMLTAKQLLQEFEHYTIVDIRMHMCYHLYHIPYSMHITTYEKHKAHVSKKICLVCNDGVESCNLALTIDNCSCLEGGLKQWLALDVDEYVAKKYAERECCDGGKCSRK